MLVLLVSSGWKEWPASGPAGSSRLLGLVIGGYRAPTLLWRGPTELLQFWKGARELSKLPGESRLQVAGERIISNENS